MEEADRTYSTYVDGQWTQIVPIEESLRSFKGHLRSVEQRNKYLEEENKKLKDEAYKDNEIAKLKKDCEDARADLNRGFGISEQEYEKIHNWIREHEKIHNWVEGHAAKGKLNIIKNKFRCTGAIGGAYTYKFIPTSIGTFGTIICNCGAQFDFQPFDFL